MLPDYVFLRIKPNIVVRDYTCSAIAYAMLEQQKREDILVQSVNSILKLVMFLKFYQDLEYEAYKHYELRLRIKLI